MDSWLALNEPYQVFRVISDTEDQDVFQSDLDKYSGQKRWQMEFTFTKCKTQHTGHIKSRREYEMNGHKLKEINKEKDIFQACTWPEESARVIQVVCLSFTTLITPMHT